jgi:hypothetical protein
LTDIAKSLVADGYVFGCDHEKSGLSLLECDILGFVFESFAYVPFIVEPIACFRGTSYKPCNVQLKLDAALTEDVEMHQVKELLGTMADTESAPSNNTTTAEPYYYCFISLREDMIYNFRILPQDKQTMLPSADDKIRIGLGVPTTGMSYYAIYLKWPMT